MNTEQEALLRDMVGRIVAEASPEQVVLFGSWARGAGTLDSDVDLLVVERDRFGPGRSRRAEMTRLRRALQDFPVPIDILVYSHDEVTHWREARNHVIARAMREGRVLYEAR